MTDESNHDNGHGSYERRDIGVAAVLYFLLALAIGGVFVHFVVSGIYSFLDKRTEANQSPMSPLITNAPTDTRHIPPEYNGDYNKYLKENFPAPQLETDERGQLNGVRLNEAQILSSYDYIDKNAGTVRIPIDRAMDLIAQRGLPVRVPINLGQSMRPVPSANTAEQKKAKK
jgi:hypothetical protein